MCSCIMFPYQGMVANTEGGEAAKSHGLGGSRGDASPLSVVIIIPRVSDFPYPCAKKQMSGPLKGSCL